MGASGIRQPCCPAGLCDTPTPARPPLAMHYPQLVSTTGVPAGMMAMGAVVGNWPGGSAQLQPCDHVLDGLPYAHIMCVSQSLECGSHAAAPAALTIRRVGRRSPSWSRGCWMCLFRSSSRSVMNAIPARRHVVVPSLHTNSHGQHLPAVARMPAHRLEACATGSRHGERLPPGLTQRDMWGIHSLARGGCERFSRGQ